MGQAVVARTARGEGVGMTGRRLSWAIMLVGLLVVVGFGFARKSEGALASAVANDPSPPRDLNATELQAFVDPYVAESMASAHVPGSVVVFVKDGTILYSRGYGTADLAQGTPVDPESTVFRLASVSKLLTATAVLQLADHHQVQLDTDVNRYLTRFQVPATHAQPVTLSTLLTHTAGFEDWATGRTALSPFGRPSLETYLAHRMPQRVEDPGSSYGYSNYSFALAGYVVENVSGQPFDQYVARQIFVPLGMDHSSFAQPLPSNLAPSLATGYDIVGSAPVPAPFEYFADPPAAAMSTTASDMARFMIFQLRDNPGAEHILSARTLGQMQALHFQASPAADFNGMAYGYRRYQRNGVLILSKEGDIRGFATYLALLPDQHIGFFVAANTDDNAWMQDLERQFVNRYFPMPPASLPATPPNLRGNLAAFTGTYIPNQSSRSTMEKVRTLTQQIQIDDVGNGQIDVGYPDGSTVRLNRVGPLTFANEFEGVIYRWAFLAGPDGGVTHFLIGNDVYSRVAWYDTRLIQLGIAVTFVLLFLAGLGTGLISLRARRKQWPADSLAPSTRSPGLVRLARVLAGALYGLNLLFSVAMAAILVSATATQDLDYSWISYGLPWFVYAILSLPLVTTALAIGMIASTVVAMRIYTLRRSEYRYAAIAILAQLAFIPYLVNWNLFGFHV